MRLTLTTDEGEVLDWTTLSADEFQREVKANPTGTLASLSPGADALKGSAGASDLGE